MKSKYSEYLNETMERIGNYGKANPELMGAFSKLHKEGIRAGVLSTKDKALEEVK